MRPETFIASKLFSNSKNNVSSVIVRIAVLSVAIGLAVMIISVAIVIGFKEQIRNKVIGFVAHIQIEALDNNASWEAKPVVLDQQFIEKLKQIKGVDNVQSVAKKAGIIRTEEHIQGVVLKGVGTDYNWNYLNRHLISGRIPLISDTINSDEVLISKNTASKLRLKTNDVLRMWFVSGENQQVRGRRFKVVGIFETGLAEFDNMYIFGDLKHVQKLNNWGQKEVGSLEVTLHNIENIKQIEEDIYYIIPVELSISTAIESNPQIFDWLDLQDMNVIIIIILMVLVSGITMISTLLIIILERTSMIGILKAMGADNQFIQKVFLLNSLAVLLKGISWGNLVAIVFCLLQLQFGFLKLSAESYFLTEVPIHFSLVHILIINLGAILIWFVTLIIPITIVNQIQPAKAIRYN